MAQESSKGGTLHELDTEIRDTISNVEFSPDGTQLLVSSWSGHLYVFFRFDGEKPFMLKSDTDCDQPVLGACYGANASTVFYVGLDRGVHRLDWPEDPKNAEDVHTFLSTHTEPAFKVAYSKEHNMLFSISWDGTMNAHDPDNKTYVRIQMPQKPWSMGVTAERLVVAMAERKVHVYELAALKSLLEKEGLTLEQGDGTSVNQPLHEPSPWQERESSLKFATRAVACMIDGAGFAQASIEGRVGVEWFDPELQKKTYAFKCHRVTEKEELENGEVKETDVAYPVGAIAFNPIHGTFATGGGDGVVALWDAQTKRRVRQYHPLESDVWDMCFSPDGRWLAIGASPGLSEEARPKGDGVGVKVYVRELAENEAKAKEVKPKK